MGPVRPAGTVQQTTRSCTGRARPPDPLVHLAASRQFVRGARPQNPDRRSAARLGNQPKRPALAARDPSQTRRWILRAVGCSYAAMGARGCAAIDFAFLPPVPGRILIL